MSSNFYRTQCSHCEKMNFSDVNDAKWCSFCGGRLEFDTHLVYQLGPTNWAYDQVCKARESLMRGIIRAGIKAGTIRPDLESASGAECLHILETLVEKPESFFREHELKQMEKNPEVLMFLMALEDISYSEASAVMGFEEAGPWPTPRWKQLLELGRAIIKEDPEIHPEEVQKRFA